MFIFIIKRNFELPQKRMVEVDQDGDVDLEQRLSVAWQSMLGQQEAAAGFIAESHRKEFGGDAGQIAFFNNRLVSLSLFVTSFERVLSFIQNSNFFDWNGTQDINRFFVDEGDSNDVPKVFFRREGVENG